MSRSKFLSLETQDWIKAFLVFLLSTVVSIVGDAIMQSVVLGSYSFNAIHWREIGAAILVAVITYLQKQLVTNSKGEFGKPEPK